MKLRRLETRKDDRVERHSGKAFGESDGAFTFCNLDLGSCCMRLLMNGVDR